MPKPLEHAYKEKALKINFLGRKREPPRLQILPFTQPCGIILPMSPMDNFPRKVRNSKSGIVYDGFEDGYVASTDILYVKLSDGRRVATSNAEKAEWVVIDGDTIKVKCPKCGSPEIDKVESRKGGNIQDAINIKCRACKYEGHLTSQEIKKNRHQS